MTATSLRLASISRVICRWRASSTVSRFVASAEASFAVRTRVTMRASCSLMRCMNSRRSRSSAKPCDSRITVTMSGFCAV